MLLLAESSAHAQGLPVITVPFATLYTFTNGGLCLGARLLPAQDGNLYGINPSGYPTFGSVFRITTSGSFSTVYSFTGGSDSAYPVGSLLQAIDGDFYGATQNTLFKLTTSDSLTTLHTFNVPTQGEIPIGNLIQAPDGNIYGEANSGGQGLEWDGGWGALFKMSASGSFTPIYIFSNDGDGSQPDGGLIQGINGNLYGVTTLSSGLFQATESGSLTQIHAFYGTPSGGVIQTSNGNLYGELGNSVYSLTASGSFTTICNLGGVPNGGQPQGGLIQGLDGNFYGTLMNGGANGYGAIFQLTTSGSYTALYSFTNASDGVSPQGGLAQGSDGCLYGVTTAGNDQSGSIFKIAPYVAIPINAPTTYQITASKEPLI